MKPAQLLVYIASFDAALERINENKAIKIRFAIEFKFEFWFNFKPFPTWKLEMNFAKFTESDKT